MDYYKIVAKWSDPPNSTPRVVVLGEAPYVPMNGQKYREFRLNITGLKKMVDCIESISNKTLLAFYDLINKPIRSSDKHKDVNFETNLLLQKSETVWEEYDYFTFQKVIFTILFHAQAELKASFYAKKSDATILISGGDLRQLIFPIKSEKGKENIHDLSGRKFEGNVHPENGSMICGVAFIVSPMYIY